MLVAHCDAASVTWRRGEELTTAASSDDTTRHLDQIQYTRRQGPCVNASDTGTQIHAPTLADEHRWPHFVTEARRQGVKSVLSSPLLVADQPTGALNLYSHTVGSFDPSDHERATTLATVVAQLSSQTDENRFDARIRDALRSRDTIATAQGILIERLGIDAATAHHTLRRGSVTTSVAVRQRAAEIVAQAEHRGSEPDPQHDDG